MKRIRSIPVSLDNILKNSGLSRIDLMVLDVEGHEKNVLDSFSFDFPVVLWLIEFLNHNDANEDLKEKMIENRYRYMGMCANDAVFIHEDYLKYFSHIHHDVID